MIFANCLTTILLVTVGSLLFDAKTCYANSGISVRVTQSGFNYAAEIALNKFHEDFRNSKIPDLEKNGKLRYKISDINIESLTKPTGHVTLAPGEGLKWQVNIAHFRVNGNWIYSTSVDSMKVRHGGTMKVSLSNTRAEITILPTMASNGGLNIKATDCSCSTDLNMHVSSWYLRMSLDFFKNRVRRELEERICSSAISAINNKVAPKLTHYPLTTKVDHDYVLDYSLESNPIINTGYLQTNHKAKIYHKGDTRPIPFTPFNSWPTISDNRKMIYFIISNYLFETWFFAAHQNNILKHHIEAVNSEGKFREMLQTTCQSFCIGNIVPELADRFPNSMVQVDFETSDRPRMNFRTNRIQMIVPTIVKVDILQPSASVVNVFNVHLKLFIEMKAKVENNHFFLSFTNMSFTFGDISGIFKDNYNVQTLQEALKEISDSVIPFIREIGSHGMPLLLPDDAFIVNPEFHVVENAIVLGADLKIEEF